MKILDKPTDLNKLAQNAEFILEDTYIKAVVDIKRNLLAVDAEMHADLEGLFLDQGSTQGDLWGINLHFEENKDDIVEFDSMINLRPSWGNNSRGVDDENIQKQIIKLVHKWILL